MISDRSCWGESSCDFRKERFCLGVGDKDQDPDIHPTFVAECKKRNPQPRVAI